MPAFDAQTIAAELDKLREELAIVASDPALAHAYGERLSRLGQAITAACERAFVDLTVDPAA